ncbi:MAG: DUF4339 domain-containing protein [Bacteroidota bacterium]|nr:DUF4339 domain-containing protein [Bacteroidota bacterium]
MESEFNQPVQWYYELNGARMGPVSIDEIKNLFRKATILPSTQVWRTGYPEWIELNQSELSNIIPRDVPPPLSGKSLNNSYVWILAFAPLIGVFLEYFVAGAMTGGESQLAIQAAVKDLWWITLALNVLFCVLDLNKLKAAGYNTESLSVFWLLLIPVYLFKRAKFLRQKPSYAWTWLAVFFLSLTV